MSKFQKSFVALAVIVVNIVVVSPFVQARPTPVGTAFTYQGQLMLGGNNVNATADFQFSLFDALTDGTQIGTTQPADAVTVTNGGFTVDIDFGAGVFGTDARWLEIAVRSPAGIGSYTTLTPRQRLQPAPVAQFALSTGIVPDASLQGTYSNTVSLTNASNTIAGSGAGLTNLNASSIASGTIASSVISGTYANALTLSNASNSFTGNGAGLTNLNASNLASGTIPSARLSGIYSNPLTLSSASNSFTGSGAGLTALNASNISSGSLGIARLPTGGTWAIISNLNIDSNSLFIDAINNRVGIGTATPLLALDVAGASGPAATSGNASNGILRITPSATTAILDFGGTGSPAHAWLQSRDSTSYATNYSLALNPNGGNVGIGIPTPAATLSVYEPDESLTQTLLTQALSNAGVNIITDFTDNAFTPGVFWSTNNNNPTKPKAGIYLKTNNNNGSQMHFGTSNSYLTGITNDAMVIKADGKVGIGTAEPEAPLHIDTSDSQVDVLVVQGLVSAALRIVSPNQLGQGFIKFSKNFDTSVPGFIEYDHISNSMGFGTSQFERVRINSLGHVEIGQSLSGTNMLEVGGNASKQTAGDWLANSDRRIKTEVRDLDDALNMIDRVRPVAFRYTPEYLAAHPSIEDVEYYNVIAQEFAEVFPDSVKDSGEKLPNGESILQVDVHPMLIHTVAAVQQLNEMISEKDNEIAQLRSENLDMRSRLETLERKMQQLLAKTTGVNR